MSARATIIVPSLADTGLLEGLWASLEPELSERDELVLVDDSGQAVLAAWADGACPRARVVTRETSGGLAAALSDGADAATGALLVVLQPDVRVEPGFLDALVQAFDDPEVGLAAPSLEADGATVSSSAVQFDDGRLHVVPREADADPQDVRPLPFAPAAAFAVRREDFVAREGLDPVLAPFGWADVDLGLATWRGGRRVVEVPAARATCASVGPPEQRTPEHLVRASYEKNRLLTFWKVVDTKRDAHDHVSSLWRDALDAAIAGRRDDLVWMALALQELPRIDKARAELGPAAMPLEQVLRVSDPVG